MGAVLLITMITMNGYFAEGFAFERPTQNFTVKYVLFTRANSSKGYSVSSSNDQGLRELFNPNNPTRFVTHGWMSNQTSDLCTNIRRKYLSRGEYNVFTIDWSVAAENLNYIQAAFDTMEAGRQVASFLDMLNEEYGLDFNNTYMIGYSLGAHVVGIAAKKATRGRINTIFGLDPAEPLFRAVDPSIRLTATDALYVESIHTNAGFNGFSKPVGVASFFPNGGSKQPGCHTISVNNKFIAMQCSELIFRASRQCKWTGKVARMGGEPSNFGRGTQGVYYVPII